ncbi:MAG: ABC transporter substrate-binding protein [Paenibacillaceae bacterium]|nr:ABC transporter substrate-binding protein [Paenibacillaceae bacterium]
MSLLLAACGSSGKNSAAPSVSPSASPGTANNNTSPSPEASKLPATRTVVDDLKREVVIPTSPKRIVAGEFAQELLALGVTPIGSGENGFKVVFTEAQMKGVERIGDPPNPEKILELKPDLVIASTVFLDIYKTQMENIAKIAPVYYISFDQDPINDIFSKVADLVGKQQEARDWIASYNKETTTAREQVKTALGNQTVSIFRVEKGRLRIYLNRNFAGYMLNTGLQVKAPDAVAAEIAKNKNGSAIAISIEQLPQFAGDHLFLIVRGEGADKAAYEEIAQSAFWKNLPAVKNGNVHLLDTDKYYGSDVVTIRETMKEAVKMLAGK